MKKFLDLGMYIYTPNHRASNKDPILSHVVIAIENQAKANHTRVHVTQLLSIEKLVGTRSGYKISTHSKTFILFFSSYALFYPPIFTNLIIKVSLVPTWD